jgi:hypothetical protein
MENKMKDGQIPVIPEARVEDNVFGETDFQKESKRLMMCLADCEASKEKVTHAYYEAFGRLRPIPKKSIRVISSLDARGKNDPLSFRNLANDYNESVSHITAYNPCPSFLRSATYATIVASITGLGGIALENDNLNIVSGACTGLLLTGGYIFYRYAKADLKLKHILEDTTPSSKFHQELDIWYPLRDQRDVLVDTAKTVLGEMTGFRKTAERIQVVGGIDAIVHINYNQAEKAIPVLREHLQNLGDLVSITKGFE